MALVQVSRLISAVPAIVVAAAWRRRELGSEEQRWGIWPWGEGFASSISGDD